MDKHLSLPSLYGYRPAIGYFRVENGGWDVRAIRDFVVSLGVTVYYSVLGFLYEKSSLVDWQASGEDCSLDPPWSYADARVCKGVKIVMV